VQRPDGQAALAELIGITCLLQGDVTIEMRPGADGELKLVDTRETGFDQFAGR